MAHTLHGCIISIQFVPYVCSWLYVSVMLGSNPYTCRVHFFELVASSMICEFLLLLQALTHYDMCKELSIRVPSVLCSKELGQGSNQCCSFLRECVLLVEACGEAGRIGHLLTCAGVVNSINLDANITNRLAGGTTSPSSTLRLPFVLTLLLELKAYCNRL